MKKFLLLPLLGLATPLFPADLTLTWKHEPDHVAITEEYRLYEREGDAWVVVSTVVAPTPETGVDKQTITTKLEGVKPGPHTYRVTAFNGAESAPSNEASRTVPTNAPTDLKIIIEVNVTINE